MHKRQSIELPLSARILGVYEAYGFQRVSVAENETEARVPREIIVIQDLGEIDVPVGRYVGTIFVAAMKKVFHVFEGASATPADESVAPLIIPAP